MHAFMLIKSEKYAYKLMYRPFLSTGLNFRGFCKYFLSTNLKANKIISKSISKQQYTVLVN